VMRRYSAYSANQVMTTTAATSMISKNNTTATSLVAGVHEISAATAGVRQLIFDWYCGQNAAVEAPMNTPIW
jgi:hypothetical protein